VLSFCAVILTTFVFLASVSAGAPAVPLAYADARDANGRAAHERQLVTVSGVASTGSDPGADATKFSMQDRSGAPYGLMLYTNRMRAKIAPGDLVTATGRIGMYASAIELLPDALRITGRTAPPKPVDVHPDELLGWRWSGVLVRTRGEVASVSREEDYAEVLLTTKSVPLHVHIAASQLPSFNLAGMSKGTVVDVIGIATSYKRRTSSAIDYEVLPRDPTDVKVVHRSLEAVWTIVGVALIAVLLIAAALVFGRPQKIRPERYP